MIKLLRKIVPGTAVELAKTGAYHFYGFTNRLFNGPLDKYDFQTIDIIKSCLSPKDNWIDIGAHKGHILKELLKVAPAGRSFAFEPIPQLYQQLEKKYGRKLTIYNLALSDKKGELDFVHVIDRPAISGFRERSFANEHHKTERIKVKVEVLDDIIPSELDIALIKVDVEGAEMQVLKGAEKILRRSNAIVLFEFGLGGADLYETTPEMMFRFLQDCGYSLSTLEYYLKKQEPFSEAEFVGQYQKGYNYFFIAYRHQPKES